MNRFILFVAVSFLLVGCGPAEQMTAAGRCTADAQCPVGVSCDTALGVCVSGQTTTPTNKPLPNEYGKYCENDSHCASIPGTTCNGSQCTNNCANGAQCPTGTTCGGQGYPGCFQNCSTSPDCKNGGMCGVLNPGYGVPAFSACGPKYPSETGGTCKDDLGCDDSNRCVINSAHPNGYCTKPCSTRDDCSLGDLCVVLSGASSGLCMPKCDSPNSASTCVPGTTCKALNGVSYGFCL